MRSDTSTYDPRLRCGHAAASASVARDSDHDFVMTKVLDLNPINVYKFSTSLAERRLPETFGGWSEGRPLRAGLVSLHSGGSGQRAGRHYDRTARCSLDGPAQMPVPGSPARSCGGVYSARNAAVERREARRPASLAGGPWRSRDRPDRKAGHGVRRSAPAPVGAPPPLVRCQGRKTGQTSGAKNTPRERRSLA
jgi:hypothetical protein